MLTTEKNLPKVLSFFKTETMGCEEIYHIVKGWTY